MAQTSKKETVRPTLKLIAGGRVSTRQQDNISFSSMGLMRGNVELLMHDAEMTREEALSVKIENIDFHRGIIILPGKIAMIKTERLLVALVNILIESKKTPILRLMNDR